MQWNAQRLMERGYRIDYKIRAFLICCSFVALTYAGRNFRLDDSFIAARYITNALHGHGLVFNVGEPVNALTSVLDTWLQLSLTWLLHGRIFLAQAILGGTFLLIAALLVESIVPFSGFAVASTSLFYFCNGMESSLFMLLLLLCVAAYVHKKINWLPLLCVLTMLARMEGGALVLVIAWQLWKHRRFPALWSYAPALLLVAFDLSVNFHFYHHLMPQSASAKLGQGMSGFWGRWPTAFLHIPEVVYRPLGSAWTTMPVLAILACFGAGDPRMKTRNEVVVPFMIFLACFYVFFNIPNYFWYFCPFVLFFTVYAMRLLPDSRAATWALILLLVLVCKGSFNMLHAYNDEDIRYARTGEWLQQNTPAGAHIAAVETGTIAWHCDRYFTDIAGLTTPANATYTAHRDFSSWFKERPDYIVVHAGTWYPWETVALQSPEYEMLPVQFDNVRILRRR